MGSYDAKLFETSGARKYLILIRLKANICELPEMPFEKHCMFGFPTLDQTI